MMCCIVKRCEYELLCCHNRHCIFFVFFFNDTATTEIYTLSLHDALPIFSPVTSFRCFWPSMTASAISFSGWPLAAAGADRKSTRLNSSHANISYAVFCLKKKKITNATHYSFRLTVLFLISYLCHISYTPV